MKLRHFSALVALVVLAACGSPKQPESTDGGLRIILDDTAAVAREAASRMAQWAAKLGEPSFGIMAAPTNTSQVDCFMVNVTGAGISSTPPPFLTGCNSPDNMRSKGFGVMSLPSARGNAIRVTVPTGNGRNVDVFGIYPSVQECGGTGSGDPGAYFMGGTSLNIAEDASVTVNVAYAAGTPSSLNCQAVNPVAAQFGTGSDGNQTFSTATDLSTTTLSNARTGMAQRRVSNIDTATGTILTTATAFGAAAYAVGDEVLVSTMAASVGACTTSGTALDPGTMIFATVSAVNTGGSTITLSAPLITNPGLINNTNIAATPGSGTFCAIQVTRVPHFNNLTIAGASGVDIGTTAYASTAGFGGLLAVRVNGTLSTSGTGTKRFSVNIAGFSGGATSGSFAQGNQGHGTGGGGTTSFGSNGNGGGGGQENTSNGAGGGGGGQSQNGALGGQAGPPPNGGAAGQGYGCSPENCAIMGGGGGSGGGANTQTGGAGGAGGGVLLVFARNIDVTALPLSLNADGTAGTASASTGGGGGGGAGGSILLHFKEKVGSLGISLSAMGGNGAAGNTGGGGAGGAGGRISVQYCNANTAPATANNGGSAGTGTLANGTVGTSGQTDNVGNAGAVCGQ